MTAREEVLARVIVTFGEPNESGVGNVDIQCPECSHVVMTRGRRGRGADSWRWALTDHVEQHHLPGSVPNIEVSWKVIADCSICEDDGNVTVGDDGGIVCRDCGTTWDDDGRDGILGEKDELGRLRLCR